MNNDNNLDNNLASHWLSLVKNKFLVFLNDFTFTDFQTGLQKSLNLTFNVSFHCQKSSESLFLIYKLQFK